MTLAERMEEAKGNLAAVKEAVESGEKGAGELAAAIDAFNEAKAGMDAAADARALLESLGSGAGAPDAEDGPRARTLGEHFAKFAEGKMAKGAKFAVTAPEYDVKDGAEPAVMTTPASIAPALADVDRGVVEGYRRPLFIADLFGSETVSGNAVTYFVESASVVGDFTAVAEGAKKPMLSFGDPVEVTETLKKVAGYYKESSEIIEDAQWLVSSINGRGLYLHGVAEEAQLLSGSGTGANIKGLLNRDGIQALTYEHGKAVDPDVVLDAMSAVETATGFNADAIVMNPADYAAIRKMKDGMGQYFGGGFFEGQYGAGTMQAKPALWGVPTYTTPAISQGTVLVGAFKQGGSVIRKGGTSVSLFNQNEDDAIYNRVTVVVESRLALAVRYPAAFVKITEAAE